MCVRLWPMSEVWRIFSASNRAVVQLGRTLEWGSRGRGFESRQPDKIFSPRINIDETQIVHGEDHIYESKSVFICGGMLSAGIVGLPNVGKSTLFNALTRTHKAPAENYPFCTIDPNLGIVIVPDARLAKLAEISHSQNIVPTAIEFVDIAGLVKGASSGEGLGNQFLHHIREVDAIVQVVRCFEDS